MDDLDGGVKMNFRSLLSKIIDKIRTLILTSHVYNDSPMPIHFSKWPKKKKYDIRKKYFTLSIKGKDDIYKYGFLLLILLFFFLLPYWSLNAGISDHEWQRAALAQQVANHEIVPAESSYLQNHGIWLDRMAYRLSMKLEADVFVVRHLMASFFGWGILVVLGFWLTRLLTWRAAFFGTLFLCLSPRFVGEATCNLCDIPFAFAYLFACYQLFRLGNDFPRLKIHRLVLLALGIALACSLHFGGGVLIPYLLLFPLLYYLLQNPVRKIFTKEYLKNLLFLFGVALGIGLIAGGIACMAYPGSSFWHISFSDSLRQMTENRDLFCQLFEKDLIWSNNVPRHYLTKYLFITTPFVILLAFSLFFIVFRTVIKKAKFYHLLFVFSIFFYPLFYIVRNPICVQEGISQFIFLYPALVLLATIGYEALLQKIDDRYTNFVLVGAVLFLAIMPLRHLALNTSFASIYFNEISGGIHNAYGRYELDPACHSNKVVCTHFLQEIRNNELRNFKDDEKIVVCTNGNQACEHFFERDTAFVELHFCDFDQRQNYAWDYFIVFPTKISSYQLKSGLWISENYNRRLILLEKKPIAACLKNRIVGPDAPYLPE